MKLTPYYPCSPWGALSNLQNEINRMRLPLFDLEGSDSLSTQGWTPRVDISEEEGRYVIKADVPGVEPDKIEITLKDGVLTLSGQRAEETKEESDSYHRIERTQGAFIRRFTMPDTVDTEKVDASCKNGVIEIVIPKKEQTQPRRISLKAKS